MVPVLPGAVIFHIILCKKEENKYCYQGKTTPLYLYYLQTKRLDSQKKVDMIYYGNKLLYDK